jgi:hypothetical protein
MIVTGQRCAGVGGMTLGRGRPREGCGRCRRSAPYRGGNNVLRLAPSGYCDAANPARGASATTHRSGSRVPTLTSDCKSVAPISGWNWLKRELDRRSGVTEWRLHDFRRSIVSICAEHGADIGTLDTLLNHSSSATRGGIVGVYQRATLLEPMRGVMALWNRLLREALADEAPDERVVPLRAG